MQPVSARAAPIAYAPIRAATPIKAPALGERGDAVLEKLGRGESEKVRDFIQVGEVHAALA